MISFSSIVSPMGILIQCGETTQKIGSATRVIQQQQAIFKAYVLYLKEYVPTLKNPMDAALLRVDNRRLARKIESSFCFGDDLHCLLDPKELGNLVSKMHPGVRKFVFGITPGCVWETYDCRDILDMIERLRPYFKTIPEIDYEWDVSDEGDEIGEKQYYLESILKRAVEEVNPVEFEMF
jgi:hypothetical protein